MWHVNIKVRLKKGILDAQGKTTHRSLLSLGFSEVREVRVGKLIEIQVKEGSLQTLDAQVQDMCRKLLANPVIEDFEYEIKAG